MKPIERILYFFILPILAVLLYPPDMLLGGIAVLVVILLLFIGLGILLMQGRALALTFSIFVQGMNVIIRLMMFFSNGFNDQGQAHAAFMITSLLGLSLSIWLLMRLDRSDVRIQMVR
jgi:hypothetical protein